MYQGKDVILSEYFGYKMCRSSQTTTHSMQNSCIQVLYNRDKNKIISTETYISHHLVSFLGTALVLTFGLASVCGCDDEGAKRLPK